VRLRRWVRAATAPDGAALNRRLAFIAASGCAVLVAYQLVAVIAAVTRSPGSEAGEPRAAQPVPAARQAQVSSALADAHLFGVAEQKPEPVLASLPTNLPDTSLALTLTGILFGNDDSDRQAIVANGHGEQRVYRVGQQIDEVQGAKVFAVLPNRLVLQRGETFETLRLTKEPPGAKNDAASSATADARAAPASTSSAIARPVPTRSDVVRVVPRMKEGAFVGFAVFPGQDSEAFAALTLKPEDVVTQVNGLALDAPDKAATLFEALGKPGPINLSFRRGSTYQSVSIDLSSRPAAPDDL
jgi:general secretion pathway protein C